ncbi:MAG: glutaconate CoA-transferase, subunit [Clostridiales bacterium]|jgi:glutaconate CoA-transferase subunit A|nr:glutaconate CoA-transferase, subunit [Clostridiales bacterium]
MNKLTTLKNAMEAIHDSASICLGGNALNRAPMVAAFELAKQNKKNLWLIKTAGALDIDLLCLTGCVGRVDAGFISNETKYSLAQNFRKAVQNGIVHMNEHACYTIISALRAACYGLPFMPVKGMIESDLIDVNPLFKRVIDPFSGDPIIVVSSLKPDWTVLHVQKADSQGNGQIDGPEYEDVLMSRAAAKVILTTEEIVPDDYFYKSETKASIPGFLVESVVHVPQGAAPGSCYGKYEPDDKMIRDLISLGSKEELMSLLFNKERCHV